MMTPLLDRCGPVIVKVVTVLALLAGPLSVPLFSSSTLGAALAAQDTPPADLTATPSPGPTETPIPTETAESPAATLTSSPAATETLTPTPQPTIAPTETSTPQFTVTATDTPSPAPTETLTLTMTTTPTLTPTPSPTATTISVAPGDVLINEVQYDPPQAGSDAKWEWIELYNRTTYIVDLAGWTLADNVGSDALPVATIAPRQFLVVAASSSFYDNFPGFNGPIVFVSDGQLGNSLSNDGDRLILRAPGGLIVDALSWGDDASVFSPPCRDVAAGHSLERMPFGRDTDTASDFGDQAHPSPGTGVLAPTPTPMPTPYPATVWLNEFLPAPRDVDWDGDGQATNNDEWIELYNSGQEPVDLAGWQLDDEEGGSRPYAIPPGVSVAPGGFLVFYKWRTGVSLNNDGDQVRLLRPDGVVADQYSYSAHPGYDRSYSRTVDGDGVWTGTYPPSPGRSNQPPPTAEPTRQPPVSAAPSGPRRAGVAEARSLPAGTEVTVEGWVTVPPGVLSASAFYIQDATAGVRVYVQQGQPPVLMLGDLVRVTGKTGTFYREVEVRVRGPEQVVRLGPGEPPSPTTIRTGQVGPAHEGMLVSLVGRVTGFYQNTLDLDDGTGVARVVFREMTGVKRPWVELGEVWQVMGVVGRVSSEDAKVGSHRVFPRFTSDVSPLPAGLPITGSSAHGVTGVMVWGLGLAVGAATLIGVFRLLSGKPYAILASGGNQLARNVGDTRILNAILALYRARRGLLWRMNAN